jgi:drug/metabolite transporter (DMT)-like permease
MNFAGVTAPAKGSFPVQASYLAGRYGMDAIWLAAGAAVGWGVADYFGGASRGRTSVLVVVAVSEGLGLCLLIPVLIARGVPLPASPRLLLAALAGAAVTVELSLIYLALSRGEGFITASVGALGAAAAATAGLIGGDTLDGLVAAGMACALVGGGVTAWTPGGHSRGGGRLRSAALCAGAASAVAVMLISFRAAGRLDPYWATAVEHASTALCAVLIACAASRGSRRRPRRRPRQRPHRRPHRRLLPEVTQVPGLALVAFAGVAGDLAYAGASQHGALSVVSAVSSLYPVTTIALGVAIQRQRPNRIQVAGIILALVGAAVLGSATG